MGRGLEAQTEDNLSANLPSRQCRSVPFPTFSFSVGSLATFLPAAEDFLAIPGSARDQSGSISIFEGQPDNLINPIWGTVLSLLQNRVTFS